VSLELALYAMSLVITILRLSQSISIHIGYVLVHSVVLEDMKGNDLEEQTKITASSGDIQLRTLPWRSHFSANSSQLCSTYLQHSAK